MNVEELSLKANAMLRRAGLAKVPRAALMGMLLIGLVVMLVALWHFWPRQSADFTASASISAFNATSETSVSSSSSDSAEILVDVEGAVIAPGLYTLPADARIGDAIEAAGGLAPDAVTGAANLAQKVSDGEQVYVPTREEQSQHASQSIASTQGQSTAQSSSGKTNINTASAEELQKLDGIGTTLSQRIVDHRQANGRFSSIEELKNVSGIGDAKFASIKDAICV